MLKNKYLSWLSIVLIALSVTFLTACESVKHDEIFSNIPRSKIDKTQQVVLKLENGAKVLIIEDPEATQSMVSIHVAAGGYEDPDSQMGLAHFLEHAIFMGSQKYPIPTDIFNFVSNHSGIINAITSNTGTTFFFRVEINSLEEGLDRLTDAIAHPKLEDKSSLAELKNIESEFQSNRHNFYRQYNDAMAESIYNPKHPISRQPTGGNLDSLKDKPDSQLMSELRNFHNKYYSGNIVNAVVYSKIPKNQLVKLASQYLNQIPNKKAQLPEIKEKRIIEKQKILHLQSEDKGRMIVLNFQIPKLKNNFAALSYIDYLLQNMQSGTAYDVLFKNNLITGLSSSYEVTYLEPEDELNIYISLTDKGIKQQDLIVNTVFNYLELIKNKGIQKDYFEQLKQTLANNFNHLKIDYSLDAIMLLSSLMQELPANHLYNYYLIPDKMKPQEISDTLGYITLKNANITYASQKEKYNQISKYYKTKYQVSPFSVDRFSNENIKNNFNAQLALPPLNNYIADDFSINNPENIHRTQPKLLNNPYGLLIYAMPSGYFKDNPNVYLNIEITNPIRFTKDKEYIIPALADIIFFQQYLGEFSQYDYANIDWYYHFSNGQTIFLHGVPQHMLSLTKDFLTKFKTFSFDNPEALQEAKLQFQRSLIEKRANMGALDNAFEVFDAFSYDFIDDEKVIPAIKQATLNDLNQYHSRLLKDNRTKIFSLGNLNDKQVLEFANTVESIFPSDHSTYPAKYFPDMKPNKMAYTKKINQENNAVIAAYYLPTKTPLENIIYARFLSYILNESFFYHLRTEKQLGYTVGVSEIALADGKILAFYVESANKTPKELYANIQEFYQEGLALLQNMPDEQFNKFKEIIHTNLTGIPQDMKDEFTEHNTDFNINNTGTPAFKQMAKITKSIKKQDVINYYKQAVIDEQGVALLSEIIGKNQTSSGFVVPKGYQQYHTLDQLHNKITFSPINIKNSERE
ncbi:hypothetical protein GKC56_05500 [Neisseriaceae bacterium PsAf]|nr:hypothetical protein [Neisseriaceae bacterium PsAf]